MHLHRHKINKFLNSTETLFLFLSSEEKINTKMATSKFQLGEHTLAIPMTLYKENRERVAAELNKVNRLDDKAVLLLQGGDSINHYDTDVEYVFRQVSFNFSIFCKFLCVSVWNEHTHLTKNCRCMASRKHVPAKIFISTEDSFYLNFFLSKKFNHFNFLFVLFLKFFLQNDTTY